MLDLKFENKEFKITPASPWGQWVKAAAQLIN